ncbi:DUF86 domain-containing protein [Leptolyngbyaceae cyanobacterium UHCC 1019]
MTLDFDSVRLRLALILDYLDEIEPLASMSLEDFLSSRYMQRAAERLLEITVQAAIDINNHLLKEQFGFPIPSNAIRFQELSRYGVISGELANQLANSGRLRNRLAHRYYEIDYEILFAILSKILVDYPLYAQQVENFIGLLEANHDAES